MKRSRDSLGEEMVASDGDDPVVSTRYRTSTPPPNRITSWNVRSHRQQDSASLDFEEPGTTETAFGVLSNHAADSSVNDQRGTLFTHTTTPSMSATQPSRLALPNRRPIIKPPRLNTKFLAQGLYTVNANQLQHRAARNHLESRRECIRRHPKAMRITDPVSSQNRRLVVHQHFFEAAKDNQRVLHKLMYGDVDCFKG